MVYAIHLLELYQRGPRKRIQSADPGKAIRGRLHSIKQAGSLGHEAQMGRQELRCRGRPGLEQEEPHLLNQGHMGLHLEDAGGVWKDFSW